MAQQRREQIWRRLCYGCLSGVKESFAEIAQLKGQRMEYEWWLSDELCMCGGELCLIR